MCYYRDRDCTNKVIVCQVCNTITCMHHADDVSCVECFVSTGQDTPHCIMIFDYVCLSGKCTDKLCDKCNNVYLGVYVTDSLVKDLCDMQV